MSDRKIVIVEWDDATALAQWCAAGHLQEPIHAQTLGWLLHEDDNYVQIVGTIATDGEYNQSMTIPKGMVVSMKEVTNG